MRIYIVVKIFDSDIALQICLQGIRLDINVLQVHVAPLFVINSTQLMQPSLLIYLGEVE